MRPLALYLFPFLAIKAQNQTCSGVMEYAECGSACNSTCEQLAPECILVCTPRCQCPEWAPVWFPLSETCGEAFECTTIHDPSTAEPLFQLPNRHPPLSESLQTSSHPSSPLRPSALLITVAISGALVLLACVCIGVRNYCSSCTASAPLIIKEGTEGATAGAHRPLLTSSGRQLPQTKPQWTFKSISIR